MKFRVSNTMESIEKVWNMEGKIFSMEWNRMEWEISKNMEWNGRLRRIWNMENFHSISFHSMLGCQVDFILHVYVR